MKELCDLVHPKVGILTGITYQHLERFGSLENIIDAKFELIESLPENGLAIIDTSGENTKTGIQQKKENFKVKDIVTIDGTSSYTYLENVAGIEFEYA
ncbi:MAG: hypothetical protein H6767_01365 [Candidatus Peribacteria bacterium]|nr:MAG: hypothetical protein H6767_01365 [Candidatus Peribacteria bacterium]